MKHEIKLIACACGCGEKIMNRDKNGVKRRYVSGHNRRVSVDERFWTKVKKSKEKDGCWEWMAFRDRHGYGRIGCSGRRIKTAHRVSWEMVCGEIPDGMFVLHRCDNPACVRPDHLFLGTQKDNMLDCAQKGRYCGTLNVGDVLEIREKYANGNTSHRKLGKEFCVSRGHIARIVNRKNWRHI